MSSKAIEVPDRAKRREKKQREAEAKYSNKTRQPTDLGSPALRRMIYRTKFPCSAVRRGEKKQKAAMSPGILTALVSQVSGKRKGRGEERTRPGRESACVCRRTGVCERRLWLNLSCSVEVRTKLRPWGIN